MRVIVVGAGAVGATALESLYEHHECTAVDLDAARLKRMSDLFDVRVVHGNGAGRSALREAGVDHADLVLACTARDEANLVTAMLVRRFSSARTVIRTADMAYLETWRGGDLDVDFIVSSEFETASAVSRVVGVPGARQADFFLDGEVQVLEFDVSPAYHSRSAVARSPRPACPPRRVSSASSAMTGRSCRARRSNCYRATG